ncbi:pentatricopeptide repeat-containing At4g18840 [Olea europaea subsp. europaea]|uniref:Pentatricopeptide repeat-containing At4g18840 n=1 Tax=Olea europaea subsp. europaea TaxID=158383 RepID=A0A8S0SZ00_OLEEU|nr:pentatricopeptide repeat-containing At4g18840 [Olea europaea subsp. europaea]
MSVPASFSSSPILSLTEAATSISQLHQAHAYMLKTGLFQQTFAVSRLVTAATTISHHGLSYAESIFAHVHRPNSYIYNTMIHAYATSETPILAFIIFLKLFCEDSEVYADKYTFTFILKACARVCRGKEGKQIHGIVLKDGLGDDVYINNTLIHMYAKCGCFEVARNLLDRMFKDDVVSWNALLSVYAEMGLVELARKLFDEMPVRNVESWNFMVSGYVNCGLIEEARDVFDVMLVKDIVSWNAMISAYAKAGAFGEVLVLFEGMQSVKECPDSCTLVNVLSSCAGLGALSQGKWVHAYIDRNRIEVEGFLATALVDMYSKCGCIEKALEVFNNTLMRDISTWNSMIAGLSIHGSGYHALKMLNQLVSDGFTPNEVTFISILSACSRAGLVSEGLMMFDHMVHVYGIQPTTEHYGCLVDLLGRRGLLNEAKELLNKSTVKQSPIVWQALLAACRNHGDVELAEYVARKLLELDPKDSAGYVQLSNVHASLGRWNDVTDVRMRMRERGLNKEPGCSTIEIDGNVHEFLAGEGVIVEPPRLKA